jgi:hypothetical protein
MGGNKNISDFCPEQIKEESNDYKNEPRKHFRSQSGQRL